MTFVICPECQSSIQLSRELDENEKIEVVCTECLLDLEVFMKNDKLVVTPLKNDAAYSDEDYGTFD